MIKRADGRFVYSFPLSGTVDKKTTELILCELCDFNRRTLVGSFAGSLDPSEERRKTFYGPN